MVSNSDITSTGQAGCLSILNYLGFFARYRVRLFFFGTFGVRISFLGAWMEKWPYKMGVYDG